MSQEKKKRILFLITKSNWGGAQRYVHDLASAMASRMDVVVASGGAGLLTDTLRAKGIRTIAIPSLERDVGLLRDLRSFWEIMNIMRTERPDIIHVNSSKVAGLGALAGRLLGIRTIVFTIHGLPQFEDRSFLSRHAIALLTWLTTALSHKVIVVTRHDQGVVCKQPFAASKTTWIPLGITPVPGMLARTDARRMIAESAGAAFDDSALWIGTIAELTGNKGHQYALEAFATFLKKDGMNARYILIGDGEERTRLEMLTEHLDIRDRVLFVGFIPNASRFSMAFDIALLSSVKEGLPYTLIEAAYAGVPAIASNVGGIPDIIDDTQSGFLVPPRDPSAITSAILRLGANAPLRARMGAAAKEKASRAFSLDHMIAKTKCLYDAP